VERRDTMRASDQGGCQSDHRSDAVCGCLSSPISVLASDSGGARTAVPGSVRPAGRRGSAAAWAVCAAVSGHASRSVRRWPPPLTHRAAGSTARPVAPRHCPDWRRLPLWAGSGPAGPQATRRATRPIAA